VLWHWAKICSGIARLHFISESGPGFVSSGTLVHVHLRGRSSGNARTSRNYQQRGVHRRIIESPGVSSSRTFINIEIEGFLFLLPAVPQSQKSKHLSRPRKTFPGGRRGAVFMRTELRWKAVHRITHGRLGRTMATIQLVKEIQPSRTLHRPQHQADAGEVRPGVGRKRKRVARS
jgi:hypothetical protein